jgi:hypothetical protein
MRSDLTIYALGSAMGGRGARLYNVAAGTAILAGEPVSLISETVGSVTVMPTHTSKPVVSSTQGVEGTFVGVAATDSTNTTAVAGTVNVIPVTSDITWLISPATAATYGVGSTPVQATYDALVGKRVLLQNNAEVGYSYVANVNVGTYSLLASDSAYNGCVVQAKSVYDAPGKVAFAFRRGTSNLA